MTARGLLSRILVPVRLARVAPSARRCAGNLLLAAAMPLLQRPLRARGRHARLWIATAGGPLRLQVDCMGDLHVVNEVWAARIYDAVELGPGAVVFDVGANIGATAAFFKDRRPDAILHCFEPDPVTFRKLAANTAALAGVTLHPFAIAGRTGSVRFRSSFHGWDSAVAEGAGTIEVPARRLADAIAETGVERVDLLKLDVEGAEYAILADAEGLAAVERIVAELHPDLADGDPRPDGFDVRLSGDPAHRPTLLARRLSPSAPPTRPDPSPPPPARP